MTHRLNCYPSLGGYGSVAQALSAIDNGSGWQGDALIDRGATSNELELGLLLGGKSGGLDERRMPLPERCSFGDCTN